MQPTATPQTHKTPDVETAIRHTVPWRVTAVEVIADARLRVTFVPRVMLTLVRFCAT